MKKNIMRIVIFVFCFAVVAGTFQTPVYAADNTVRQITTYNDIIKSENIIVANVCERSADGSTEIALATVNLKTNRVKILIKNPQKYDISSMRLKGNYLYHLRDYFGHNSLYRTNIKTGKSSCLARNVIRYAINGYKIYFRTYYENFDTEKTYYYNKVMRLDGKNKKKTSIKAKMVTRKKNTSKYSLIKRFDHQEDVYSDVCDEIYTYNCYRYYLQEPNGRKVFIITARNYF